MKRGTIMNDLTTGFGKTRPHRPATYYTAAVACYLAHVESGQSIRTIAAAFDLHPSTVMRRIRKIELMRDDPLVDHFLTSARPPSPLPNLQSESVEPMTKQTPITALATSENMPREVLRILRRLCETGAFLAISKGLDRAVVMRQNDKDMPTRTAVVDGKMAGEMVLKDWLRCTKPGRISCYEVTSAGRSALKRALAQMSPPAGGFAEAPNIFTAQHKDWGTRDISGGAGKKPRAVRVNLRESPLAMLGRKKGKDGKPFLPPELVAAGERFREDFELAQIGPRVAQNWDSFLTPRNKGAMGGEREAGYSAAQQRFSDALQALGTGLGDIAMRCCCFLEGLEMAEKRLGWSARSGKIVLRIALQRLWMHYEETGDQARRIG
jgi:hypothetical protein